MLCLSHPRMCARHRSSPRMPFLQSARAAVICSFCRRPGLRFVTIPERNAFASRWHSSRVKLFPNLRRISAAACRAICLAVVNDSEGSHAARFLAARPSPGGAGDAMPKPDPFGRGWADGRSGGRSGLFSGLDMADFSTPFSAGPRTGGFFFVDSPHRRYARVQPDGDLTPGMAFLA